jgi:exodeoxyribonuclease VII large subunit
MPTPLSTDRDVYSVSRLNREARALLERGFATIWIEGELSNFARPASGHWYFSLKDATAQVRCAMFRQRNMNVSFAPRDGAQVLGRGRVSLYEPRGDYQLIIDHMEEAGEGALRRQFEELKARLQKAGLFAEEHKRALPPVPRRIGVITSPTGAALRDILHILKRRFPAIPVLIYPVPVQGAAAAPAITQALNEAGQRADCDVIILARGGGSLEDLWAFNDEALARAIYDCPIPVVTGIGHEIDFTIADFVADRRAPTPSGAAEIVVPDQRAWLQAFADVRSHILRLTRSLLARRGESLVWLTRRLQQTHPGARLAQQTQRLDDLSERLRLAVRHTLDGKRSQTAELWAHLRRLSPEHQVAARSAELATLALRLRANAARRIESARARLEVSMRALHAVSPLATLERGYAVVTREADATLLRSSRTARPADRVRIRLTDGSVRAVIEGRVEAEDP